MNRFILLVTGLLFYVNSAAQDGWELKKDRDDIVIYTRESDENPLKEYKATVILNSPLSEVYSFLTDLEYRPAWVIRCKGLQIIDTLDGGSIRYQTSYDIPWPLADRDLLVRADLSYDKVNRRAELNTRHTDLEYPLESGMVRMPLYKEHVFLEEIDSHHTKFRAEGFANPGGYVPAWLVNMFMVDGIYDSMIRTQEEIDKRVKNIKDY